MTQEKLIEEACFQVNPNVSPATLAYAKAVGRELLKKLLKEQAQ